MRDVVPSFCSRRRTTPTFFEPPPLITKSSSPPTARRSPLTRSATPSHSAARMSRVGTPWRARASTSDFANTTHVLLIVTRPLPASRERRPTSTSGTWSSEAMTSRARPVPAAHLSFMRKLVTRPAASHRIALQSCPPMSRMVRTPAKKWWLPRAWQAISVTFFWANGTTTRPYPVATVNPMSSRRRDVPASARSRAATAAAALSGPVRTMLWAAIAPSTISTALARLPPGRLDGADVPGHAAGEDEVGLDPHAPARGDDLGDERLVDPPENVGAGGAAVDLRHDLRLGEHGTGAGEDRKSTRLNSS